MSKPIVIIYVNPGSKSTIKLDEFLADNIDQINEHLYVKRIKVTGKNVALVKKKGIDHTPTLVYNRRKFVSLEKIIRILTPPAKHKDHFGYGNTSSNDLIHQYHSTILDTGDENAEDDDMDPDNRTSVIRNKMAAFQKRRPQMDGVSKDSKLKGGRKVKATQPAKSKFDNDDEFRKASRVDNISETPARKYLEEDDGAMILEDYYLNEANMSGKQVGRVVSKRR
jgi:hypothetical protein